MSRYEYDLFVIGGGSGGIRAARLSSSFGARVAIAEEKYLGGTCVNVGCVPKKLFFYASHFSEEFNHAKSYGWYYNNNKFVWDDLIKNKNKEIKRLNGIYQKILDDSNVKVFEEHAKIIDPHTIKINNENITTKYIMIATGGWPYVPNIEGKELAITSNEAFFLETLPNKIIIVGGGYIAVEFASIFKGLNIETSLIYRGPLFLRGFDKDLREVLSNEMKKKGINLIFNKDIKKIKKINTEISAELDDGQKLMADQVMFATGRRPNCSNIGLDEVGLKLDADGAIEINSNYQTNISSIYAVGDVTNRINLTPVALAEGSIVANNLFNNTSKIASYENIPSCVFSQPNIATVGLTEDEARKKYKDITVYKSLFTPLKLTLTQSNEKSFIKLITNKKTNLVIGAHMVGENAGEIMQGIAIAIKAGATKDIFDSTIGIHPTLAEEFVTMRNSK